MAAKGSIAKEQIISKILSTFDGAFKYDKELRIPVMENGEEVQIKITLTCAKANVYPATAGQATSQSRDVAFPAPVEEKSVAEPSAEEKANVERLIKELNLNRAAFV